MLGSERGQVRFLDPRSNTGHAIETNRPLLDVVATRRHASNTTFSLFTVAQPSTPCPLDSLFPVRLPLHPGHRS